MRLNCLGYEGAHPLGGILLHFIGHVGVGVQGEARAVVAQDAGHCFGIYTLLNGQGCEGMPLWHNKDKSENLAVQRVSWFVLILFPLKKAFEWGLREGVKN